MNMTIHNKIGNEFNTLLVPYGSLEDLRKALSFYQSCAVQASLISPMMSDGGACGGDLICCSYTSNITNQQLQSFIVACCSCG